MIKSPKNLSDLLSELELTIHSTNKELQIRDLSKEEQKVYKKITNERKKSYWLKGRKALKNVLEKLGENTDTSTISFPNPRFSITHSGDYAVAIGCKQNTKIKGIGIDIELNRYPRDGSEKYFLSETEIHWLHSLDIEDRPLHRLRLWTIKEAAYKAYPHNKRIRLTLLETKNPEQEEGNILVRDLGSNLGDIAECNYFSYSLPLDIVSNDAGEYKGIAKLASSCFGIGYLTIAIYQ